MFFSYDLALKNFGHISWGAAKPTIIMTDSKPFPIFFQTKMIPPPLWNACNFALQLNFVTARIPGKMNTVAEFLSGLQADPKEKTVYKKTSRHNCQAY